MSDAPRAHPGLGAHLWAAAGGLALLGATALPWSTAGFGSTISLLRLADLVVSGTARAWVPRGLGLIVYLIPLGGALVLIGSGLGRRRGLLVGALGVGGAAVGTLAALLSLAGLGRLGLGAGPALAIGGLAAATVGLLLGRPRRPGDQGGAGEETPGRPGPGHPMDW